MEIRMSTMIIQVIRDILLSEIKSESTSARSRNTRHLSLSTWMRGLISRYSRIARYSGWRVGSDSQIRFGTSRTFEAAGFVSWSWKRFRITFYSQRLTSTRLLKSPPSSFTTSSRVMPNSPVNASLLGTSFASSICVAMFSSKKLSFVLCAIA
jgi:hypothetical protein